MPISNDLLELLQSKLKDLEAIKHSKEQLQERRESKYRTQLHQIEELERRSEGFLEEVEKIKNTLVLKDPSLHSEIAGLSSAEEDAISTLKSLAKKGGESFVINGQDISLKCSVSQEMYFKWPEDEDKKWDLVAKLSEVEIEGDPIISPAVSVAVLERAIKAGVLPDKYSTYIKNRSKRTTTKISPNKGRK